MTTQDGETIDLYCAACLFCVRTVCNNPEALMYLGMVAQLPSCPDYADLKQELG